MSLKYDLLVQGGRVIDPSQNIDSVADVGFKDGLVLEVNAGICPDTASNVIDASNKLVTPGLIDLHGHFAFGMHPRDVDAEIVCTTNGITTCVDAGSTGWINFPGFKRYVIDQVQTRIFAFLHLSSMGSVVTSVLPIPDLGDFRLAREEETIRCIEDHPGTLLGVKVRLTPNGTTISNAIPAMQMARRICDQTGTLLMVHVMETPIPMSEVLTYLKPGDIVTHAFHGDTHSIVDSDRLVRPEVWDAYNSGVIFDTGGAARHCSFTISKDAMNQGLIPHTISTDRVVPRPNSFNYSLHQHMSIFLEMGLSMLDTIKCVTSNPATVIGKDDLGTFKTGAIADATIMSLDDGEYEFDDGLGHTLHASHLFTPVLTIKDGILWDNDP